MTIDVMTKYDRNLNCYNKQELEKLNFERQWNFIFHILFCIKPENGIYDSKLYALLLKNSSFAICTFNKFYFTSSCYFVTFIYF